MGHMVFYVKSFEEVPGGFPKQMQHFISLAGGDKILISPHIQQHFLFSFFKQIRAIEWVLSISLWF